MWASALTSTQKIAALCYAKHSRSYPTRDRAWCTYPRLIEQTGIRSRNTVSQACRDLVAAGWLEDAGPRPGHSQITVYRLAVPEGTSTEIDTGIAADEPETSTDFEQTSTDFDGEPVQKPTQTSTKTDTGPVRKSVRESLSKDPLKDPLERISRRDDDAARLRPASPPGENQDPAMAEGGPTLSETTRETIAAARALLGENKRPTSRWASPFKATATQPKDVLNNPHYDPDAAARARKLLEELPDMPPPGPESVTAGLVDADR